MLSKVALPRSLSLLAHDASHDFDALTWSRISGKSELDAVSNDFDSEWLQNLPIVGNSELRTPPRECPQALEYVSNVISKERQFLHSLNHLAASKSSTEKRSLCESKRLEWSRDTSRSSFMGVWSPHLERNARGKRLVTSSETVRQTLATVSLVYKEIPADKPEQSYRPLT